MMVVLFVCAGIRSASHAIMAVAGKYIHVYFEVLSIERVEVK